MVSPRESHQSEETLPTVPLGQFQAQRSGQHHHQKALLIAWSHKSSAAVDYTPIGVEPHGPTQGVWPIATAANDSQLHLVASSI